MTGPISFRAVAPDGSAAAPLSSSSLAPGKSGATRPTRRETPNSPKITSARVRLLAVVFSSLTQLKPICSAAIWQSPRWSVATDLGAEAGYDSNLYLRRDAPGDAFISADPQLLLSRRDSLLHFVATAAVRSNIYLQHGAEDSVDPSLSFQASWPDAPDTTPRVQAGASLARVTEANEDVGRIVSRRETRANAEFTAVEHERLSLQLGADAESEDYFDPGVYSTDAVSLTTDAVYQTNERHSWDLRYIVSWKEAKPPIRPDDSLRTFEQMVQVGGHGEFSPKISGNFHAGVTRVTYATGGLSDRNELVADADLQWAATETTQWGLRGSRSVYFSAFGETTVGDRCDLLLSRQILYHFTAHVSTGYRRSAYVADPAGRRDAGWVEGAGIDYRATETFTASLSSELTDQTSTLGIYTFDRWRTVVSVHFHL